MYKRQPLDSLSREESLPLLVEHYFAIHALGLIFGIKKGFGGPDLMQLLDPDLHCLLYTSDAADERSSVDLGGRRIIKKKINNQEVKYGYSDKHNKKKKKSKK